MAWQDCALSATRRVIFFAPPKPSLCGPPRPLRFKKQVAKNNARFFKPIRDNQRCVIQRKGSLTTKNKFPSPGL